MGGKGEFILSWNGDCFFCRGNVPLQSPPSKSVSVHSLQTLSEYLKIDRRKVLYNDGSEFTNELLSKIQSSRLKVELCSECGSVNQKLYWLLQQLEKIKMDVMYWLGIVLSKLETDESTPMSESKFFSDGKLLIVETLRKETMQKCQNKLKNSTPKIPIQNLSMEEIQRERFKLKCHSRNGKDPLLDSGDDDPLTREGLQTSSIKTEYPCSSSSAIHNADADANQSLDDFDESSNSFSSLDDNSTDNHDAGVTLKFEPDAPKHFSQKVMFKCNKCNQIFAEEYNLLKHRGPNGCEGGKTATLRIAPPTKPPNPKINLQNVSDLNPNSGKLKCRLCSKEYGSEFAFCRHYRTAHVKFRYKCPRCDKEYRHLQDYKVHYEGQHLGVRFRCHKCGKEFKSKFVLGKHVQANSREGGGGAGM